jgi:hypothetical protein
MRSRPACANSCCCAIPPMCSPTPAVSRSIDVDHTIPYLSPDKGGPPGQTRLGNLGPHTRRHHREKTHGRWQVRQPEAGTWLWRSPHGRIYLVNASGTHPSATLRMPTPSGMRRPASRQRSQADKTRAMSRPGIMRYGKVSDGVHRSTTRGSCTAGGSASRCSWSLVVIAGCGRSA